MILKLLNIHLYIKLILIHFHLDYSVVCVYRKWGNNTIFGNIFLFNLIVFFFSFFSPTKHFIPFEYMGLVF